MIETASDKAWKKYVAGTHDPPPTRDSLECDAFIAGWNARWEHEMDIFIQGIKSALNLPEAQAATSDTTPPGTPSTADPSRDSRTPADAPSASDAAPTSHPAHDRSWQY